MMTSFLMGREINLRGPDARIRVSDAHPADSDYFRLEHMLLTPDDARSFLRDAGFSWAEAQEYLTLLSMEVV
jgi:hypothetical protein